MTATLDAGELVIKHEPGVYREDLRTSFFQDLALANLQNDQRAWDRLFRNQREHEVEKRGIRGDTTDTGIGGEFAPPLWAIDKFRLAARAGRVLGDLATQLVLPAGVQSIHVPKTTTGADAAIQPGQPGPITDVDQVTTDLGSSTDVVTIAGEVTASQQLFDLTPDPGYDGIVYKDLSQAYNQTLEKQMLAGSGSNGQMTGITKVAGIGSVSGSGVSTTQNTMVQNLWPLMGQAAAIVGNNRLLPADVIIMAPRRYYGIVSALDGSNRVLGNVGLLPNKTALPEAGGALPVDRLIGINTYTSGGIIGATPTTADYIVVARVEDMLIYESADHYTVNTNPTSGTLQIKLVLHKYVCFINAYASSIAVVTSIPQPTNF